LLKKFARRAFRVAIIMSLSFAGSCGTNVSNTSDAPSNDVSNTIAVVTPSAPPPATPDASAPSLSGETVIADNFNPADGIEASPGPTPASVDDVGAFRMFCTAGQLAYVDPIVFPGGVAPHLHQFWGNTGITATTTYQSLRTAGQTTCGNAATPINRSAYWMPAMLDGAGNAVKPDLINTYYKQLPASNPGCAPPHGTACVGLPDGLKYVVGYDMITGKNGPLDTTSNTYWNVAVRWECWSDDVGTPKVAGWWRTIAETAKAGCPAGAKLVMLAASYDCWDGKNLDSADHRSHMADGTSSTTRGVYCDDAHPYRIPNWQVHVHFTTDANFIAGRWHLSSDEMVPGFVAGPSSPVLAGTTWHMDYFEGWSSSVKAVWQQFCIDAHKSCASGDLGNGTQIKGAGFPTYTPHQLVPVS
jgi:hypothetical protein